MSPEKPNLGKLVQQWGFYFIMQRWHFEYNLWMPKWQSKQQNNLVEIFVSQIPQHCDRPCSDNWQNWPVVCRPQLAKPRTARKNTYGWLCLWKKFTWPPREFPDQQPLNLSLLQQNQSPSKSFCAPLPINTTLLLLTLQTWKNILLDSLSLPLFGSASCSSSVSSGCCL